jgi:hypothetical protein
MGQIVASHKAVKKVVYAHEMIRKVEYQLL